ncbi:hypothetical protein RRG08_026886 [Elysia crispata]|uniref:Uncharacterized protein n=1 Tax=Elysia crispata TaxID=231223 RepID=A0AAE1ADZ6_9GAST|nr:hypothetical protein RRG08_026886 [Elysia crispata]
MQRQYLGRYRQKLRARHCNKLYKKTAEPPSSGNLESPLMIIILTSPISSPSPTALAPLSSSSNDIDNKLKRDKTMNEDKTSTSKNWTEL